MITRFLILALVSVTMYSQVGINTTNPTATLDVDGTLKIRTVSKSVANEVFKDSILVISEGVMQRATGNEIVRAALPTTIKGGTSSSGFIAVSLLTGSDIIPFNSADFDTNSEWDASSYTYTAKQSGIFNVGIQIAVEAGLGAATNFGVLIKKNGTVISKSSYAIVHVAGVNVTPPARATETLVELAVNDTIQFYMEGDNTLGTVNMVGDNAQSHFSIHQVR